MIKICIFLLPEITNSPHLHILRILQHTAWLLKHNVNKIQFTIKLELDRLKGPYHINTIFNI